MHSVLQSLSETAGILGSMVISHDGMVIASCLGSRLNEEKVAAMASHMVMSTNRSFAKQGIKNFRKLTLAASHGKILFTDTGIAYLVVVMERDLNLGPTTLEIEGAAMRIRALGEMKIA